MLLREGGINCLRLLCSLAWERAPRFLCAVRTGGDPRTPGIILDSCDGRGPEDPRLFHYFCTVMLDCVVVVVFVVVVAVILVVVVVVRGMRRRWMRSRRRRRRRCRRRRRRRLRYLTETNATRFGS